MTDDAYPIFRTAGEVSLTGTMAIYDSQAEASQGIPRQWQSFLLQHPRLASSSRLYGASPCMGDHKIHYLVGVVQENANDFAGEKLTLEAGEYAFVRVNDVAKLRDTWIWLLGSWLPSSGRRERNAPEFEHFTSVSEDGTPNGPVEIWIPLEPHTKPETHPPYAPPSSNPH